MEADGTIIYASDVRRRLVLTVWSGEISVSAIIRGFCANNPTQFTSRDGYAMRGFGDDITLYEVLSNRAAQSEPV